MADEEEHIHDAAFQVDKNAQHSLKLSDMNKNSNGKKLFHEI